MSRSGRNIIAGTVLMSSLVVLAVVGMRARRGEFAPPQELKPGMVMVKAGFVYVYGARAGSNRVLFDTGADLRGRALVELLSQLNSGVADVHDVFLTHGHGDHRAGTPLLPQARIWLGQGDVDLAAGRASPGTLLGRLFSILIPAPPVQATQRLTTDEKVDVGGGLLVRCLPMPGHTAGSYAFLFDDVLFVGDAIQAKDGTLHVISNPFDLHSDENRQSIVHLASILTDTAIDRVCTSHGGCTASGDGSSQLRLLALKIGGRDSSAAAPLSRAP